MVGNCEAKGHVVVFVVGNFLVRVPTSSQRPNEKVFSTPSKEPGDTSLTVALKTH